jgi:hypothetical protein
MLRKPLTTTHPHNHVITRKDRKLGLLRISKNASTESKVRLDCHDWIPFAEFDAPVVAFLREPVSRFFSSVPETMLRMTHFVVAEPNRLDRVEVPVDVYDELAGAAQAPVEKVIDLFLELAEYTFFDAHHEPQHAFMADRHMALSINPYLYLTESFEQAITEIEARFSVSTVKPRERGNKGGAKPHEGRTALIDFARKTTGTGVYKTVNHSGFLGQRYNGSSAAMQLRDLNDLANHFSREVKAYSLDLPEDVRKRIEALYALDCELWQTITQKGGNVQASEVWPKLV